MSAAVTRIAGSDLVDKLCSGAGKPVVIDVRDQDFLGGHIKGAINVHSDRFLDDDEVDEFITEHLQGANSVVVHCALSQVRGPFCAGRLASRLAAADQGHHTKVQVLQGGFSEFSKNYRDDKPEMFADLEANP